MGTMLRNCYMLEGTVLFDLGRYKEAIEAFSNVASLYPDDPFVLETFVQIANCWRRLNEPTTPAAQCSRHRSRWNACRRTRISRARHGAQSRRMAIAARGHEQMVTVAESMSRLQSRNHVMPEHRPRYRHATDRTTYRADSQEAPGAGAAARRRPAADGPGRTAATRPRCSSCWPPNNN